MLNNLYDTVKFKYFLIELKGQPNKAVMRGQSFTALKVSQEYKAAGFPVINVLEIGESAFYRIEEANK